MIDVRDVHMSFYQGTSEVQVLKGLSLAVSKSETVAIRGPSGSGKSTLLSLLSGLELPSRGHVAVAQTDLARLSEEQRTQFRGKNLGIVFQQYHLIPHLTAVENVRLPIEIDTKESLSSLQQRAEKALAEVGLSHRLHHFPHQMSGGENQRVAIARALVTRPALLLADEPSGSLDEGTGSQVLDLLFQLIDQHKMTAVFVTHSDELSRRCRRQLSLHDGRLEG